NGKVIYVNANPPVKSNRHKPAKAQVTLGAPVKLASVVNSAAERNHVDPALVQAVIQNESAWNPNAVSPKGAFGLMQLIPSTAERFGVGNVFDPAQNIEGGTRYLRELLDLYHGDLKKSLAAYNAGEQAVARFGGVPAYPETRAYVRKVTNTYFQSGSGHSPTGDFQRHFPIREVTDRSGRALFTNE
ncbi:MAG: lytic transglycosylase domain-containing protein, partial [Candidatus Acidiferrales bacterium]